MNFVTIPVCCGLASRGLYCGTYDVFGKFVEYGYTHIVGSTMLEICGGRSRRRGYPSLCVGRERQCFFLIV